MSTSPQIKSDRIRAICELTGLEYCDSDCGCHDGDEDPEQFVFPCGGGREAEEWVPDWMNCAPLDEVDAWLVAHEYLEAADAAKGKSDAKTT